MLSDLPFADLLILPDGSARLKGCPGTNPGDDQRLIPVPKECLAEIEALRGQLPIAFMQRSKMENETREIPKTIRHEFGGVRYRVADLHDVNNGQAWFLRRLPDTVPTLQSLGLLPDLTDWLLAREHCQGLVLICGAQASGKTTTAGALVADRLNAYGGHAVTFENPSEMPLAGQWGEFGQCIQTEILSETELAGRIEMAHRFASPNIILVGEIKTRFAALEVLRVALGSNQQMVIATIHGLDLIAALERLINWAQELDGQNARQNLANSLLAVIRQDLQTAQGKRVLDVPEFLLVPFTDDAKGIRAQLRDGNLQTLANDIKQQRNRLGMGKRL